jgi:ABC-2 type transport system ATP-binding protein
MIQFKNVDKNYKHQRILEKINLTVAPGEFFGLVGVNGAGKTTLIKSLLDLCDINKGHIRLFNLSHRNHQARNNLAFLPEQFFPPSYLTGQDFLTYMARLYGHRYQLKPTEKSEQIYQICQTLDFSITALKQPVRDYSKGMAQKIGLISCFLSHKKLLVLDEPMTGLDPKARAYLKNYLLKLRENGTTLFFSTHLLVDVEVLCDRMAILHEGRLQFVGTPQTCCEKFAASDLEQAYLNCIQQDEKISN